MRLLNFISLLPLVTISLLAPDMGAANISGGNDDPPTPAPAPAPTPAPAPEPEGNTLEEKLTSAGGIIGKFFSQVAKLTSDLAAAVAEATRLEEQFTSATAAATAAQADAARLTGELATATATIAERDARLSTSSKNVERLESLCALKGIDPKQAIPASIAGDESGEALYNQWKELKKTDPAAATVFLRKHSAAMKGYADTQK